MNRNDFVQECFKLKWHYEKAFPYSSMFINFTVSDRHYIAVDITNEGDDSIKRYTFENLNELRLWIDDKILYSKMHGINIVWG